MDGARALDEGAVSATNVKSNCRARLVVAAALDSDGDAFGGMKRAESICCAREEGAQCKRDDSQLTWY